MASLYSCRSKLAFWICISLVGFLGLGVQRSSAADYYIMDLNSQQAVDVYFQVNVSGKVYLKIENPAGKACAKLWWIKWPLGDVKQLGEQCGMVTLDIPGLPNIAAKLRASGDTGTKILVTAEEKVANSVSIPWN